MRKFSIKIMPIFFASVLLVIGIVLFVNRVNAQYIVSGHVAGMPQWIGPEAGNWNEPSNWDGGAVPTSGDAVTIIASSGNLNITVQSGETANFGSLSLMGAGGNRAKLIFLGDIGIGGNFTIGDKSTVVIQNSNTQSINGNLAIMSGGILTHADNGSTKEYGVDLSVNNLNVQVGGLINVDGLGYDGSIGAGASGTGAGSDGNVTGGGGAYGGNGGDGYTEDVLNSNGGFAYGDFSSPNDLGSGGGGVNQWAHGGNGGGSIKITVRDRGTATVNGEISARGNYGTVNGAAGGGGGAGGSIWLNALGSNTILTGGGVIVADGGRGASVEGGYWYFSGGGGGGRIAVTNYFSNTFTGTFSYSGGIVEACCGQTTYPGGEGTFNIIQSTVEEDRSVCGDGICDEFENVEICRDDCVVEEEILSTWGLFWKKFSQRAVLLFTVDPLKDTQKRIEFAKQNLQIAKYMIENSNKPKVYQNGLDLLYLSKEYVKDALEKGDSWMHSQEKEAGGILVEIATNLEEYENNINAISQSIAQASEEYGADSSEVQDLVNEAQNFSNQLYNSLVSKESGLGVITKQIEDRYAIFKNDRDRDGIPDDQEAALGLSIYDFDTDGDGLPDKYELEKTGTDPTNTDSDGDGYWDGLELMNGYNPLGSGALEDAGGAGYLMKNP